MRRWGADAWRLGLAFTAVGGVVLGTANAVAASGEKTGYHFFNPTPPEFMRELSTDRPDQTESPFTVDAGHFQLEMDFVNATFDRDQSGTGDVQTEVWEIAPLNLKVGLLNNVDLQFVLESYVHSRVEDRGANTVDEASGFGDVQSRLKINLWGNDGGKTAFAIMPFVKWPLPESSLRNGKAEGGVILPLAVELPCGWSLGVMTEFDFVRDDSSEMDTEYFNTLTIGHDIAGDLGGYVEFAALVTPERDSAWQGQVALGFTYGFGENTRLDFGCNFGVTPAAPDFNPFVGMSRRF